MNLKNDFYRIKNSCQTDAGTDFTIELNPEHFIYQSHFPNNPITPGVCIIQIIKELSEDILKRELFLKKLQMVKFINVINPIVNKEITFSVSVSSEDNVTHKVDALVHKNDSQFAKLTIRFINQ